LTFIFLKIKSRPFKASIKSDIDTMDTISLNSLIERSAGERAILSYFKNNLQQLGEACSFRPDWGEYIVFSEFPTLEGRTDFVVLNDRSRMAVVFIEIKGADFNFLNTDGTINAKIHEAAQQIRNRCAAVEENYYYFRNKFHQARRDAEAGTIKDRVFLGRAGRLLVDPDKDIYIRGIVIGGRRSDTYKESKARHLLERESPRITFDSWDSWLERNEHQEMAILKRSM
jgi:hypothetical protein